MANDEPRALGAALAAPVFHTRGGGNALHAANRHVDRWAPEGASAERSMGSMRSLGFVDRLVSPWVEAAQRSASLRLFSNYQREGTQDREGNAVSWVFPRPWYQDELDWMAAARQVGQSAPIDASTGRAAAPNLLTTRGTYIAPQRVTASPNVMPSALYEFVAPSLSIAQPHSQQAIQQRSLGGRDAYSPLVSLAAVQAAELMSRTMAPMFATTAAIGSPTGATAAGPSLASPALRNVLSMMLARAATTPSAAEPTRIALNAPELVVPPHPRAEEPTLATTPSLSTQTRSENAYAAQVATDLNVQRVQVARLESIARASADREIAQQRSVQIQQSAVRGEAELRQRAERVTDLARAQETATQARAAAEQATVEQRAALTERARLEERVAQRLAERVAQQTTTQQRLHEASRTEAAQHARTPIEPSVPTPPPVVERRAPAEVIAAIAALPPELAAMIARTVAQRPDQAAQAIAQVSELLRTAELMARSTAANQAFEVTRGPRVMMPAGMGGLVAAVERAPQMQQPMGATGLAAADALAARRAISPRVPAVPNVFVARQAPSFSTTSTALGATAQAHPAALAHVAWADRWLARFAGANPQSLETLGAASTAEPTLAFSHLAAAAPGEVFVAPSFDIDRVRAPQQGTDARAIASAPAPIQRFDDAAETPDDVFLQISAQASKRRVERAMPAPELAPIIPPRLTMADHVAHAAPSAPDAGLSAQLSSSPFAPALRHVLPLPTAPSFDVRALFGSGLTATYLAGLLGGTASHEMDVAASLAPAWAQWTPAALAAATGTQPFGEVNERIAPDLDLSYVAPSAFDEPTAASNVTPGTTDQLAAATASLATSTAPLTTLRTALLSWTSETSATIDAGVTSAPSVTAAGGAITSSAARSMLESMSLPMLSDQVPEAAGAWTSPGMMADRAFGWSVAQERNAADLSHDFVSPELVLAARVYGLGPAEAAQAARLALAGPGQLTAMAGTVDRTFVQAMQIEADRPRHVTTAFPTERGEVAAIVGAPRALPTTAAGAPSASVAPTTTAAVLATMDRSTPSSTSFGVERRTPRGAFLWPAATIAALGLSAPGPDGEQSMSIAALEMLAAQAVAEIGTYAALESNTVVQPDGAQAEPASAPASAISASDRSSTAAQAAASVQAEPAEADVLGAAAALIPASRRSRFDALYVALSQSPSGRTWSPAARAARALALAGRGEDAPTSAYERAAAVWDVLPIVYATEGMSTQEAIETQAAMRGGGDPARMSAVRENLRRPGVPSDLIAVESRPGLSGLSSRAGEALGSYVAPSHAASFTDSYAATSSPSPSSRGAEIQRDLPVMQRAPSAAQELVRTGRPSGRHGGGEPEIPAWFEAAARKMLGERTGNADGISMAEMTFVNAAPSTAIAASTIGAPSTHAPVAAGAGTGEAKEADSKIDIEQVASDVYHQIMLMMEAARQRNGEPYL